MFLEREEQLDELLEIAQNITHKRGQIVLVKGEAGIGKTTFLLSARQQLEQNFRIRWGTCDPLTTPRTLGPFHDMYSDFSPAVQAELTQSTPSFAQLSRAVISELEKDSAPGLMIIEDAHWADNATLDLLKCISRRISFLRTVLIISFRTDEATRALLSVFGDFPQAKTTRLSLPPLSQSAVESMAVSTGNPHSKLYEITGGNPFFVTEVLASQDNTCNPIADSIQDAVSARLQRLDEPYRQFLQRLSVVPHQISLTLINGLFGDDAQALIDHCVERNFLKRENTENYRFRHELARLGTLSSVSREKQKSIHKQILTVLGDTDNKTSVDQLLCHANGAGLREETLELAQQAAAIASKNGSHAEAAQHYKTALDLGNFADPATAAFLHENWSYESALVEITDETIEARHQALKLWKSLQRFDKVGENLRWLSRLHWYRGESVIATGYIEEAIKTLESTQPCAERAMAYSLKSQFYMLNDKMDDAIRLGHQALELEAQFNAPEVRAHALCNIGSALLIRDNIDGIDYLQRSLNVALNHNLHEHAARVYTNTASSTVCGIDWEVTQRAVNEGVAFDTENDLDSWTNYLIGVMAQLKMEQSHLEEAETIASGVLALENQTLLMKLPSLLVLSKVSLRLGRDDSEALLNRALEDALSVGEPQYIIPAHLGLVEYGWQTDNPDMAIEHLEALQQVARIPPWTWRGADHAIWMHRYTIPYNIEIEKSLPLPFQLEVDGDYRAASKAWLDKGSPFRAAVALLQCPANLAATCFPDALKLLIECGANGTVQKVKTLARQYKVDSAIDLAKRGPRRQSRQHPAGFTAKEQQIFPLLVEGMSNKEISESLSRSQRTIENHVASILRKLNVKNRMEAMLRANNEPWLIDSAPQPNGTPATVAEHTV